MAKMTKAYVGGPFITKRQDSHGQDLEDDLTLSGQRDTAPKF